MLINIDRTKSASAVWLMVLLAAGLGGCGGTQGNTLTPVGGRELPIEVNGPDDPSGSLDGSGSPESGSSPSVDIDAGGVQVELE